DDPAAVRVILHPALPAMDDAGCALRAGDLWLDRVCLVGLEDREWRIMGRTFGCHARLGECRCLGDIPCAERSTRQARPSGEGAWHGEIADRAGVLWPRGDGPVDLQFPGRVRNPDHRRRAALRRYVGSSALARPAI
ncbi:MAG: hypothetical protein AVDCRST_MAG43-2058, partial [uncultured Thermomicrobiales bacterium]